MSDLDTSQPTEFCVYLSVRPGQAADFLAASLVNRDGARTEPGNLRFEIYRSSLDVNAFLFVEAYDSVESVTRHRETPHFLTWLQTAGAMLSEPRKRVPGQIIPDGYVKL